MKLLFIDHECHNRTCSAEFFLEIVRNTFDIAEHYYSRHYKTMAENAMSDCDGAIIWEFPISRCHFYFYGKVNVFVPMYDNEWASFWQWKRIAWSGMGVISFCDKVSRHARRCGVENIIDVRYFPDMSNLPQGSGDPKRVFLWERGDVGRSVVERLFPPEVGWELDVKAAEDFIPKDEYWKRMSQCGVVVAPRRKEGIGMAFLEAMSMGKCVVANDDATMNEYIQDGETGILFGEGAEKPVDKSVVSKVHKNIAEASSRFRNRWLDDVEKINIFLANQKPCRPSLLSRLKIALSYPLFLIEGVVNRMRESAGR